MSEGQPRDAGAYAGRPSLCRQCGALVGAGEQSCGVCGAPATPGPPAADAPHAHDRETVRFLRAVIQRPATFTFAFLIANVFLYVLMSFSGGATGAVLVAYGAKLNYLIDEGGQWWRFVTPIFLHVYGPGLGPLHLISNMYGLFMLGPYVEKLYGSARFVVIWIVTGVAGVAASYLTVRPELARKGALADFLFKEYDVPSAGASGALFGLIGVLFVFGIKFRHELPDGLKRAFGAGMMPTIVINLFIGYFGRGFIDNAAHLGGLVAGMLLGLLVGYKRVGARGPVAYTWHLAQLACLALVVTGFVMVARHFNDAPPGQAFAADAGEAESVRPEVAALVESLKFGMYAADADAPDRDAVLARAILQLERTPNVTPAADQLRDDLKTLLARTRDLQRDRALAPDERERRRALLAADYESWYGRYLRFGETEGRALGLRVVTPEAGQETKK